MAEPSLAQKNLVDLTAGTLAGRSCDTMGATETWGPPQGGGRRAAGGHQAPHDAAAGLSKGALSITCRCQPALGWSPL